MSKNFSMNLYINDKKFSINIPYNYNTTLNDALEIISYSFPEFNVCPCFAFQYRDKYSYSDWKNKDINEKLSDLYYRDYYYRIIKSNNNCQCDQIIKENYKKSKIEIIKAMKQKNDILKGKIKKLDSDIKRLIQEREVLEIAINGDISKINELKKLGITGQYLKPIENIFGIDKKTNQLVINDSTNKNIGENKKLNFEDFYDVIVDINSIKDITKGWKIKMSKRAKENYEKFKKNDLIKIGVIGNANKGKSFLLSKISKIKLPSGTSIRTEGLSIKYPEIDGKYKNRTIALLDSAGLETPVLKEENENTDYKTIKDYFKEKSREKLITELFLQNYIINNSDILIVVVGIFTYSEQKLLNRIKTEMQRAKINKPLIVIHNLMTYTTIDQVKEYINLYLLKSVTFTLKEKKIISTKTTQISGTLFYEIINSEQKNEQKIFHLIFANEGSEAGNYYNNLTLDFLENSYQNVINIKPFDVIETIKERFLSISKEIIQKTEKTNNLKKENFDNGNNEFIKLNIEEKGGLTLKKCLIDELGFSNLKGDGFEPTYNYYKKDDKIIVKIEGPGNTSITKTAIDFEGEYIILKINGLKKKDKEPEKLEDNMYNSREFGEFSINIFLKIEECIIKNQKPNIKEIKGEIILEYLLEEKNVGGQFIVNEENEV